MCFFVFDNNFKSFYKSLFCYHLLLFSFLNYNKKIFHFKNIVIFFDLFGIVILKPQIYKNFSAIPFTKNALIMGFN
ncbi:MAG: hypothetical protein C0189_02175 [Caldisericum exile]|uniref:Uncharacterized protein n=1 Tax=Caldisericum exile TaxID=693075 RepID=A0A2J6WEY1_9BACT|nr:MAG: hypothetical protein C0189_02175 [Caldisericum exile]